MWDWFIRLPDWAIFFVSAYLIVTLVISLVYTYRDEPDYGVIFGWPILAAAYIVMFVLMIVLVIGRTIVATMQSLFIRVAAIFGYKWPDDDDEKIELPPNPWNDNFRGGGPSTMI
jgi:hypothetical protein